MIDLKSIYYTLRYFISNLVLIFLSILAINQFIFYLDQVWINLSISEPSLGILMTASVALSSLYLAWVEFVLKRQPFVRAKWDLERDDKGQETLYLKLINMGERTVSLTSFDWAYAKEEEDSIYLNNVQYENFEEDKLPPHEDVRLELETDVYLSQTNNLSVIRPDGLEVEINPPRKYPRSMVHNLSDEGRNFQRKIRDIFREMRDADYRIGRRYSFEELEEKDIEELTEDIEQNSMNIWARLNQWYQSKVYDIRVIGSIGRDPITRILSWLSVRRARKKSS